MARTRTTPESKPAIELDTIEQFAVNLAYDATGTVDPDGITFTYVVNNRDASGNVIESNTRTIKFANWPASVKADLKAVYTRVLADAENQGLIGAGTDTDDLA